MSTYSLANAANRNLFTSIPIVSWSGVGPDVSVTLYHNSGSVDGYDGSGLGSGWSVSYTAALDSLGGVPTLMRTIADDRTEDTHTYDPGTRQWIPPPGVHDIIGGPLRGKRKLTHKDGSYHRFNATTGQLVAVGDGLGNEITVTGAYSRPSTVTDASGRVVEFIYDGSGDMIEIKAHAAGTGIRAIPERSWTLAHGEYGITKITDPSGYFIDIGYEAPDADPHNPNGRITMLTDMRSPGGPGGPEDPPHTYKYKYVWSTLLNHNELLEVIDPDPVGAIPSAALTQSFSTFCPGNYQIDIDYTDRRGQTWKYETDRAWEPENGPLRWTENPLGQRDTYVFDADLNMTSYTDAESHVWDYTFDGNGNVLTVQNASIAQTHTWTYGSYNNVTSYQDPNYMTTTYQYNQAGYPRLMTSIVEPGFPAPTTTFEYYIQSPIQCDPGACDHGQLRRVTDPNGVVTDYDYDDWGQFAAYSEGLEQDGSPVYKRIQTSDGGSRMRSMGDACQGGVCSNVATRTYDCWWAAGRGTDSPGRGVPERGANDACVGVRAGARGVRSGTVPAVPSAAPEFPPLGGGADTKYDALYRTTSVTATIEDRRNPGVTIYQRDFANQYDELGQTILRSVTSDEWGWLDSRDFTYTYDWASGEIRRVGADGAETVVYLNVANRVWRVSRRDPLGAPLLRADYTYYANGLVQSVMYSNLASTSYEYDAANRLTQIDHKNIAGESIHLIQYLYNKRDLPITVTESGISIDSAMTTYDYDNRSRLINELRVVPGSHIVYDLIYEYDAGGNRTRKVDLENNREIVYHYDVNFDPGGDPNPYDSENNRLMYYEVIEPIGGDPVADLVSTTYYEYNEFGNVTRVISNDAGSTLYTGTRLVYASNGSAVTYVTDETWQWDGVTDPTNYNITYAREFRYDGSRARYLVRKLDPAGLLLSTPVFTSLGDTWSDYDGNIIYGDFTADADMQAITETRSYEPGIGRVDDPLGAGMPEYYHTDLLGSTRVMSAAWGGAIPGSESTYTAFGEPVPGSGSHRYGYAGAYGYQTATSAEPTDPYLGFPFQHVGARYYDPATGRFLQRDPIGIRGGLNVYEYVRSSPSAFTDSTGLGNDNSPGWYPGGFGKPPWSPRPPKPKPKPKPKPPTPDDSEDDTPYDPYGCAAVAGACIVGCSFTGPYGLACVTFCVATLVF